MGIRRKVEDFYKNLHEAVALNGSLFYNLIIGGMLGPADCYLMSCPTRMISIRKDTMLVQFFLIDQQLSLYL